MTNKALGKTDNSARIKVVAAVLIAAIGITGTAAPAGATTRATQAKQTTLTAQTTKTTGRVDALSYDMDLRLDTSKNRLHEKVKITFRNRTNKPVKTVRLRDMTVPALKYAAEFYKYEGNKGKKSKILSIRESGGTRGKAKTKNAKYKTGHGGSVIRVTLGKPLKPGSKTSLTVRMWTDIPNRQDRFALIETKKGKLYMLSFCFPYLADNLSGRWCKDPFFDDGESRSFDRAKYKVRFKAPKKYLVASGGKTVQKKGVTKISTGSVRDFAIVACNFMKKHTFKAGGTKIHNYYLKSKNGKAYRKTIKLAARDSIRAFKKYVGKCPFKELSIAQCLFGFAFGGMEYPGLIMVNGSEFFTGSPSYGTFSLAEGTAHEIGHQWFYSAVGNREYREAWLDEGFTTYATTEYFIMKNPATMKYAKKVEGARYVNIKKMRKERADDLKLERKSKKKNYINIPPYAYGKDDSYGNEYSGGDMFLQELRAVMGRRRFSRFFKSYYGHYYGKRVTTKNAVRFIKKFIKADNSGGRSGNKQIKNVSRVIKKYINKKYA